MDRVHGSTACPVAFTARTFALPSSATTPSPQPPAAGQKKDASDGIQARKQCDCMCDFESEVDWSQSPIHPSCVRSVQQSFAALPALLFAYTAHVPFYLFYFLSPRKPQTASHVVAFSYR